ncbi:hypothetical protein D3C80_1690890 [compost metagenome]
MFRDDAKFSRNGKARLTLHGFVENGATGDFFYLPGTRSEHNQIRFGPMRFRGSFHLYEFDEVIADDIDVVRDFTPDTLDRFVTQHLSDVKSGNTILEDEAVLGGNSASVIRFHLDFHGIDGLESMAIAAPRPYD